MEYLEGETLAQRLTKGALPLDQALRYAIEIADALDKAHRKGITHRDLKPGNIMVTKAGTKLLDFGLAKLKQPGTAAAGLSALPTQSAGLTQQGTILGTLQYMSPEQLEGKDADARTDIFAFGTTVYEMATGKKAFEGKSQASLIHSIMGIDPPPVSSLQSMTPPALDHVVKTCLTKDPDGRWQTAGDVGRQLQWIAEAGSEGGLPTSTLGAPRRAGWRRAMPWVAGVVVSTMVAGVAVWTVTRPATRPASRFAITLPSGFTPFPVALMAISPDGRTLVYAGPDQLYRRDMGQLSVEPIPGTEGALTPFFSPDGQWVGFSPSRQALRKVSLAGGPSVPIAEGLVTGASWGRDETILFGTPSAGLSRVSAAGGEPEPVTTLEESELSHRWPNILPGGKAALFTVWSGSVDTAQIAVVSLETGEYRTLVGGTYPRYASTGHIVFGREASLWAVQFDADRLEVTGSPVPVLEGVRVEGNRGAAQFALANDGSLLYVPGGAAEAPRHLVWVDREGREEPLPAEPRAYTYPRISPDGTRVALDVRDQERDIWIWDVARETLTRLTFDAGPDFYPVWTPDGEQVVFSSPREGSPVKVFWKAADGTGAVERLAEGQGNLRPYAFSPDGQRLVLMENRPEQGWDLNVLSLTDERTLEPLVATPFEERNGELSPDGNWLAYQSNASGEMEVYVRPFPNVDEGQWLVSTDGGTKALFR